MLTFLHPIVFSTSLAIPHFFFSIADLKVSTISQYWGQFMILNTMQEIGQKAVTVAACSTEIGPDNRYGR